MIIPVEPVPQAVQVGQQHRGRQDEQGQKAAGSVAGTRAGQLWRLCRAGSTGHGSCRLLAAVAAGFCSSPFR